MKTIRTHGVFRTYKTLDDIFDRTNANAHIRVFCGCRTIFNGKRYDISEREWNIIVRPYLHCEVIDSFTNNNIVVVMI